MKDFNFQEVLFEFEIADSTNEEAKRKIQSGEGGLCFAISAKTQTAGRGRINRKWTSDFGNLFFTIAVYKNLIPDQLAEILPLYTAFCVMKKIGEKAQYKWANDVLIEGKKVCGILIESFQDFFIIGIGVNVKSFPLDSIFPASCLQNFDLSLKNEDLFYSFVNNFETSASFIINFLSQKFFSKDEIQINQGQFSGFFERIEADGSLVIKVESGDFKKIVFGDIDIKI